MPLVSKTEAAKLAGVTRQTIHRKVKSGDLSAIGGEIDTSELLRVFGTLQRPLDIADQDSGNKAWATKPDPAVEVLARVDALESQLAVTREQLADTSKDRDEWREIAKEATSNVKLITNQGSAPKSNDNMMIFVAVAFVVGIGVAYMMLRNDVTPSDAIPLPAPVEAQSEEPVAETIFDRIPTAQVPPTSCSIYDIGLYSRYNPICISLHYINFKLEDQVRLQNKFPDAEHMRVSPAEALASRCLNDGLLGDEWIAEKCPEAILELADMYDVELHPNELSGKPTDN